MTKHQPGPDVLRYLPLKPVQFLILFVLMDSERHGYGIVKEILRLTDGSVRLEPGNLYRFIKRLMEFGMVRAAGRRSAPESKDERRRYYRITDFGTRVFDAETARMKSLVMAAEKRVGSPQAKASV